jgi:hypothetical protein
LDPDILQAYANTLTHCAPPELYKISYTYSFGFPCNYDA